MDDAKLRRGKPTIHIQFGENVAILASVALLSRAFHILSQAKEISPLIRTRLVSALAETVGTQEYTFTPEGFLQRFEQVYGEAATAEVAPHLSL